MKAWILGLAVIGFSVTATAQGVRWETSVRKIESGPWKGARLEDGQPDIQGNWSNTIANHNNFTDPQGAIPGDPSARTRKEKPRDQRAPSRVSSTAEGQIPFQPWAHEAQQDLQAHLFDPTQPQYIEPLARCAPARGRRSHAASALQAV